MAGPCPGGEHLHAAARSRQDPDSRRAGESAPAFSLRRQCASDVSGLRDTRRPPVSRFLKKNDLHSTTGFSLMLSSGRLAAVILHTGRARLSGSGPVTGPAHRARYCPNAACGPGEAVALRDFMCCRQSGMAHRTCARAGMAAISRELCDVAPAYPADPEKSRTGRAKRCIFRALRTFLVDSAMTTRDNIISLHGSRTAGVCRGRSCWRR
jgi:hypothetical protein